jgi:hypothetical protein
MNTKSNRGRIVVDTFTVESQLKAWERNRQLRYRVPRCHAWRGCLGLGLLMEKPDDTIVYRNLGLVRNDQLKWVAMRDVPPGCCPSSPALNCRGMIYVTTTTAELRYGMPYVDFTCNAREAVDFARRPIVEGLQQNRKGIPYWAKPAGDTLDASELRMLTVLNRISAAMTDYAFFATDRDQRPFRPHWFNRRPPTRGTFLQSRPSNWMPKPYLAFHQRDVAAIRQCVQALTSNKSLPKQLCERALEAAGKGIRLTATNIQSTIVLFPAQEIAIVTQAIRPLDIWWDTVPALPYYDWETQSAAFPPVRIAGWEQPCLGAPYELYTNATIVDPRLDIAKDYGLREPTRAWSNRFAA